MKNELEKVWKECAMTISVEGMLETAKPQVMISSLWTKHRTRDLWTMK